LSVVGVALHGAGLESVDASADLLGLARQAFVVLALNLPAALPGRRGVELGVDAGDFFLVAPGSWGLRNSRMSLLI
jgi:hypothetical protein